MTAGLQQSDCPNLTLIARGKVRELYQVDTDQLLFVATDRVSAFDVVMTTPIPDKGKILTQLSLFWFDLLGEICPNHLITADIKEMPAEVQTYEDQLAGRCMLVKKLTILPVEAIVRGYVAGSGWKDYQKTGGICSIPLPEGLLQGNELAEPIYTPSTKAELGAHDENISLEEAAALLGDSAQTLADTAKQLYAQARAYAKSKGILIADTKFEFGLDAHARLTLADEVLTPDSSRFWPAARYTPGQEQESYDKQFVREYLESISFDKTTPIALPDEILAKTREKYIQAFETLTGLSPDL
jgi:phosphoribosylaminoimidazole-succinocarboxamide synthase